MTYMDIVVAVRECRFKPTGVTVIELEDTKIYVPNGRTDPEVFYFEETKHGRKWYVMGTNLSCGNLHEPYALVKTRKEAIECVMANALRVSENY